MDNHYVVVDTETTGLPANRPDCPVRGIQIGLALVGSGRIIERWSRLVKPPVWAPSAARAQEVHGISRERVERDGVTPADCWREVEEVLAIWSSVAGVAFGAVPMLAWNAPFDTTILHRLGVDAGKLAPDRLAPLPDVTLPVRSRAVIAPQGCLMRAYKSWAAAASLAPGGSLDAARRALRLPPRTGHHDAADDAALAGEVLLAMARSL